MPNMRYRLRTVLGATAAASLCCSLLTGCADEVTGRGDEIPEGVRLILASGEGGEVDRPAWIDDETLIFSWNLDPQIDQLWTVKLGGGNPVRFISDGANRYLNPSYSPALNMVAFEVIESNLGGSNVDAVTVNGPVAGSIRKRYASEELLVSARYPCWGPNGHSIGYLTTSQAEGPKFEAIELDDNIPPRQLEGAVEISLEKGKAASRPVWYAPSGGDPFSGKVAYDRIPSPALNGREIFYYDFATESFVHLTDEASADASEDMDPSWSPDGMHIVYSSDFSTSTDGNADFRRELYIVSIATRTVARLTRTGANESQPAWSPDGTKIAYISDGDLYTLEVDSRLLPE